MGQPDRSVDCWDSAYWRDTAGETDKGESVRYSSPNFGDAERTQSAIELYGVNPVKFGGMLPENRREWLCAMLQQYFNDSSQVPVSEGSPGS